MKNAWKVVVISIILGIALMIAGFMFGARSGVSFGRSGVILGDIPLRNIPRVITRHFDWVGEYNDRIPHDAWQTSGERSAIMLPDEITGININVASAHIEFVTSDDFMLEIADNNQNRAPIRHAIQNGVLEISQDTYRSRRAFGFGISPNSHIVVSVPGDIIFDTVNARTVSGRVNIESVNCRGRLAASTVSGSITLNGSTADSINVNATSGNVRLNDIATNDMHISVISGNTDADRIRAGGLTVDSISGRVTINGELTGQTRIDTTSGTIRLTVQTNGESYQKDLSVLSGNININGQRVQGRSFSNMEHSDNRISINALSGDIHLDLE